MSENSLLNLVINAKVNNTDDLSYLVDEIESAGHSVDVYRREVNELGKAWDKLSPEEQQQRLGQIRNSLVSLSSSTNQFSHNTNQASQEVDEFDKKTSKLSSSLSKLGVAFGALFGVQKIKAFFSSSISGAKDLEAQLSKVAAVSGATDEQMQAISQSAEKLGASTKYTATQAAQGFEILARAGLNAEQSLTTIPSVLSLAQAAGIELADAASFVTKSVAGMNLQMSDSGRVADVLAKAVASANTDVAGLGQALSYAAPSAAGLGVSLEQTVAIIGKFADAGIDASRAGTALNSIMAQFSNPASKFRSELAKIGITTSDFNEALHQLAASGNAGSEAILAVGQEAGPALKALLAQGMPALDELVKKLQNAKGSADEMADKMTDNLSGAVTSLGSAWDGFKNSVGKPLLAPITAQVNKLTEAIRKSVDSGSAKAFGDTLASIFGSVASGVGYLTTMSGYLVKIAASFATAKTAALAYSLVLGNYNKVVTLAKTASYAFSDTLYKLREINVANTIRMATRSVTTFSGAVKAGKMAAYGLYMTLRSFGTLGIGAAISMITIGYEALASKIDEVREAQHRASREMVDADVAMHEVAVALQTASHAQSEYLQKQKQVLAQEKITSEQRIQGYQEQIKAAREKTFVDTEVINAATQAIAQERKRNEQMQKTIDAIDKELNARKKALELQQQQLQNNQASIDGWDKLTGSIDKVVEAQLKIPKRSQEIIDGLQALSQNAEETGENLRLAFNIAIADIETPEALRAVSLQLEKLKDEGRVTGEIYADLAKGIKDRFAELPAAITPAEIALNKLGITAKQLQTGIRETAEETISQFGLAATQFGTDADKMQQMFTAAMSKMSSAEEFNALKAKLIEVATAAGLPADAIQKMVKQATDAANKATPAFNALANSIQKATKVEQLQQFGVAAKKAFDEGKMSAEQYKQALDDIATKSTEISAKNVEVSEKSTQAKDTETQAITTNAEAVKEDTAAKQENNEATRESTSLSIANAEATEVNAEALKQATGSTENYAGSLNNLSLDFGHSTKAAAAFAETVNNNAGMGAFWALTMGARAANEVLDKYRSELSGAVQALDNLNRKSAEGTLTQEDLAEAARYTASQYSVLNDSQLDKINAEVDKARQKLETLEEQAKKTAQSIHDRLLNATGSEEDKINLKYQREKEAIQEKDGGANRPEYQQALNDLEKLRQIELKKLRERKAKEQQRQQEREQRQQSKRHEPPQITQKELPKKQLADDFNRSFTDSVNQADLSGFIQQLGENAGKQLITKMTEEAKRRAN